MKIRVSLHLHQHVLPILLTGLLLLVFPLAAAESGDDDQHPARVVGGYFEEWSIYFAGFNIANLQANGVANKLTHLIYAFGKAAPSGCAIADSWADYQSPYLPSVSGAPYSGPLYGNFAALQQLKQLHPNLKVLISLLGAGVLLNISKYTVREAGDANSRLGRRDSRSYLAGPGNLRRVRVPAR